MFTKEVEYTKIWMNQRIELNEEKQQVETNYSSPNHHIIEGRGVKTWIKTESYLKDRN